MKNLKSIINSKYAFAWIALDTALLLLIPLIGMQLSDSWNWTLSDFVIAGVLIYIMSSLFVLAARRWPAKTVLIGFGVLLETNYICDELAVGIFTNLGS